MKISFFANGVIRANTCCRLLDGISYVFLLYISQPHLSMLCSAVFSISQDVMKTSLCSFITFVFTSLNPKISKHCGSLNEISEVKNCFRTTKMATDHLDGGGVMSCGNNTHNIQQQIGMSYSPVYLRFPWKLWKLILAIN